MLEWWYPATLALVFQVEFHAIVETLSLDLTGTIAADNNSLSWDTNHCFMQISQRLDAVAARPKSCGASLKAIQLSQTYTALYTQL